MPLSIGTLLGPYEILGPLGAGGMGEVYRARDSPLWRDVAIKVSNENFTERFEREARSIAALNHPQICTLYDVGPNYLVMELIEGETLAERLRKGKLPSDQVLRIGTQIAGALASAHARRVIHRDLTPGNIMLTKAGVKVLDFGLAKSSVTADETQPRVMSSWARRPTWRPSSAKVSLATLGRTCSRLDWACMKWPPASGPPRENRS